MADENIEKAINKLEDSLEYTIRSMFGELDRSLSSAINGLSATISSMPSRVNVSGKGTTEPTTDSLIKQQNELLAKTELEIARTDSQLQVEKSLLAAAQERVRLIEQSVRSNEDSQRDLAALRENEKKLVAASKQQIDAKKAMVLELQEELRAKQGEIDRSKTLASEYSGYTASQIAIAQQEVAASNENIDALNKKKDAHQSEISAINTQIRQMERRGEFKGMGEAPDLTKQEKAQINALKLREQSLLAAFEQTKNAITAEKTKKEQIIGSIAAMQGEEASFAEEQQRLQTEYDAITSRLQETEDALATEQKEHQKLAYSLFETHAAIHQLKHSSKELTKEKDSLLVAMKPYEKEILKLTERMKNETDARDKVVKDLEELQKQKKKEAEKAEEAARKEKEAFNREARVAFSSLSNLGRIIGKVGDAINDLVKSIRQTQQQFGITASQAASIKFSNLAASIDSYISAILPGGKSGAPVTGAQIAEAQGAFRGEFGGIVNTETAKQFAQRQVEEGISVGQQATARRLFMTMTGDRSKAIEQETRFIQQFENANMTAKDAMDALTKNSELFARNGTRFADQFTRAAIEAKKIGVDLNKVDQVGDNIINNFEGFLESSAELGALGFGLDTSRLAEISVSGDTAALANELQAQLRMSGKDLFNLNRPERLAIESALGMTISEMQKLVTGKGSGETLEELQKKSNGFLDSAVDLLSGVGGILTSVSSILTYSAGMLTGIFFNTGGIKGLKALPGILGGMTGSLSMLARLGIGGAGLGIGIGGAMAGREMVKQGYSGAGILTGSLAGLLAGGALAIMTGGAAIPFLVGGALAGGGFAASGLAAGDDVVSRPGYGKRMLVTQNQAIALNNNDNVMAYANDMVSTAAEDGIRMLSYGELGKQAEKQTTTTVNVDLGKLEQKLDAMIRTIGSMKVEMDGTSLGKVVAMNESRVSTYGPIRSQRVI